MCTILYNLCLIWIYVIYNIKNKIFYLFKYNLKDKFFALYFNR